MRPLFFVLPSPVLAPAGAAVSARGADVDPAFVRAPRGQASSMKSAQPMPNVRAIPPDDGHSRAAVVAPAQPFPSGVMSKEISRGRLSETADAWRGHFDAGHGGFGDPPIRPEPERLRFLLRTSPANRDAAPADVLLSLDR
jgi:hypothetical protein